MASKGAHRSKGHIPTVTPQDGHPRGRRKCSVWLDISHVAKLDKELTRRRMLGDNTVNRSDLIRELVDEHLPQ